MKSLITLACIAVALVAAGPTFAGTQQEKMKGCNKEAKESNLAGDARKAFMSKCLKKDYVLKSKAGDVAVEESGVVSGEDSVASTTAPVNQKSKMKSCNADAKAKDLKGDERKKFMSDCLKT